MVSGGGRGIRKLLMQAHRLCRLSLKRLRLLGQPLIEIDPAFSLSLAKIDDMRATTGTVEPWS